MNAYIASFMLLVFNAVGLAVPETEAVAEELVASDTKATDANNSVVSIRDMSGIERGDQCFSAQANRIGDMVYQTDGSSIGLLISSDDNFAAKFNSDPSPAQSTLVDNQYVEGAP